jgi:hypothetical protein
MKLTDPPPLPPLDPSPLDPPPLDPLPPIMPIPFPPPFYKYDTTTCELCFGAEENDETMTMKLTEPPPLPPLDPPPLDPEPPFDPPPLDPEPPFDPPPLDPEPPLDPLPPMPPLPPLPPFYRTIRRRVSCALVRKKIDETMTMKLTE